MRILAALALAAALSLAAPATAHADDAWDSLTNWIAGHPDVPDDFYLKKDSFGDNNVEIALHILKDLLFKTGKPDFDYKAYIAGQPFIAAKLGHAVSGTVYFGRCLTLTGRTTAGNADSNGICMTPGSILDYTAGDRPGQQYIAHQDRHCSVTVTTKKLRGGTSSHHHDC